ncbi:MAG: polymer-forming cytoskeletal protein [Pseudomonadota bacterium]
MNRKMFGAALALLVAPMVSAEPISAFALFGGNNANIGNGVTVTSGLVGSNNIMSINGGTSTLSIMGNGNLSGGAINASGDVIFNGNVNLSGAVHTGTINSGGTVTVGNGAVVNGDIRALGQVNLGGNSTVSGNVDSAKATGVAVALGNGATVAGIVTHTSTSTVSIGGGASIGGNNTSTPPTPPTAYVPTVLAAATVFTAGTTDVNTVGNQTTSLAAGDYRNIDLGSNNVLNLGAGTYHFNTFKMAGSSKLNLNLAGGDIFLYFAGNVSMGNGLDVTVTGGDASGIYAETLGNWSQDGSGEWFGTIFGSGASSDIHFGASNMLTGAFYARDVLDLDGSSTVTLMGLDQAGSDAVDVPEPSSVLLGAIGLLGLGLSRRARRSPAVRSAKSA